MKNKNSEIIDSILEEDFPPIDPNKFKPMKTGDLINVLGLTIKRDETNKVITFLAQLSAYTEDSQLNLSFNAPSSTGKSFIPTEIADLFPNEDVIEVGYCSPTAFFHQVGEYDKEKQGYIVNLSRKILIFLDQPHTLLLQHLRPMLSHDRKEILIKITDKSQRAGLRTKNIYLIGYPTVIFCTAGLNIDEQEATRFLLLSPEINQEKIREAILEKIQKDSNTSSYVGILESNPLRRLLKERIIAIRDEKIQEISIGKPEMLKEMFLERIKSLKPRHQRDIGRVISLVKIFSLINLWFREKKGQGIVAGEEDIREAFKLWDSISESQELNLPPYILNLYKEVVLSAFNKNNSDLSPRGISRQEIITRHYEVYGRYLPDWQLRQQIIPMLETAGLIFQEADPNDKRKILIYPTTALTISHAENNSEPRGGVNNETDIEMEEFLDQIEPLLNQR